MRHTGRLLKTCSDNESARQHEPNNEIETLGLQGDVSRCNMKGVLKHLVGNTWHKPGTKVLSPPLVHLTTTRCRAYTCTSTPLRSSLHTPHHHCFHHCIHLATTPFITAYTSPPLLSSLHTLLSPTASFTSNHNGMPRAHHTDSSRHTDSHASVTPW